MYSSFLFYLNVLFEVWCQKVFWFPTEILNLTYCLNIYVWLIHAQNPFLQLHFHWSGARINLVYLLRYIFVGFYLIELELLKNFPILNFPISFVTQNLKNILRVISIYHIDTENARENVLQIATYISLFRIP